MAQNINYRIRKEIYDNGDEICIPEWKYNHDNQWFAIQVGAYMAERNEDWARKVITEHKRTYRIKVSESIIYEE